MQQYKWLPYTCGHLLAITGGVTSPTILPILPNPLPLCAILLLAVLWSLRHRRSGLYALYFVLGLIWGSIYGHWGLQSRLDSQNQALTVELVGTIESLPEHTDQGQRFIMHVESSLSSRASLKLRKVMLSTYQRASTVHVGQRWLFTAQLKPPRGFKNWGGFDYEGWLFANQIDAVGYVKKAALLNDKSSLNLHVVNVWREKLRDKIDLLIPNAEFYGVISALVIGDADAIPPEQWRVFNRTSTSHLIAISGLHISMIAGFFFFISQAIGRVVLPARLFLYVPLPKIAALLALGMTTFYSLLSGLSIPTQRTLIMVSVSLIALVYNRAYCAQWILCLALCLVVLWDPLAVVFPGFWLSFTAVVILIFGLSDRVDSSLLRQWFKSHYVIFIGLLPILMIFLNQFSLVSPLANAVAVPVMSLLVTPLSLIASAIMFVSETTAQIIFIICNTAMVVLWHFLETLSNLAYASIALPMLNTLSVCLLVLGIALLMLPRGFYAKYFGIFALALFLRDSRLQAPPLKLTVLDVGQGLAVVIETQHHRLIYDTGPFLSEKLDGATAAIIPYLRQIGAFEVDALVVSHSDNDHAGGLKSLLREMPIKQLISGSPMPLISSERCVAGQHWQWDSVLFEMLWPYEPQTKENNQSCVLKISWGSTHILLTGDIEKEAEHELLAKNAQSLSADILVIPHHGSKTSSLPEFINKVSPQEGIFSSGYLNRFRHPHPAVVARYQAQGVILKNTSTSGAVQYQIQPDGTWIVREYRRESRHYWDASTIQ